MTKEKQAHLYAFATVLLWATAYVYTKVALESFSPTVLGAIRYYIAAVLLFLVCIIKKTGLPAKADIPFFILSGLTGFGLYITVFNLGSATLGAVTSSVIIASVPIITGVFASFIFREKIRPLGWAAIGICFCGILVLTLFNGVLNLNKGVWWMILAAFLLSCYNLTQRRLTKTYSAFQATAYSIFVGAVFLLIFLPQTVREVCTATPEALGVALYLGVLPSAVSYVLWSKAISLATMTSQVTNYMFLTPLLSGILGFFVIMEVPDQATLLGGAIILAGLILFAKAQKR